jgi:hypothetical protein
MNLYYSKENKILKTYYIRNIYPYNKKRKKKKIKRKLSSYIKIFK